MQNTLDDLKSVIGKRVKFYRKQRGITQVELANKIGYASSGAISEIENGKKAPSIEKLQEVAAILKVPVSILVTPIDFDGFDKKKVLFSDLVMLLERAGNIPALDILHTIVKSELEKVK